MIVKKIIIRLISYLDHVLSRIYDYRHPGLLECKILTIAAPVISLCQPNDKWNLHIFIKKWLKALKCPTLYPLPESKSVFIFCAYRGVFTNHLILAILLAWRGHHITLGYLPMLQSPNKPPLKDHSSAKQYLKYALQSISFISSGKITCIDLTENIKPVDIDEDLVYSQAGYDTIMAYQKETLDYSDPEVFSLNQHMAEQGRRAQLAIRSHFLNNDYDICIIGNGTTFVGAQACRVMVEIKQPVNTTEKFFFRGVRVINHGDHFLNSDDIDLIWENRESLGYTREPFLSSFLERARESIRERSINSTDNWYWELQRAEYQTEEEAFKLAGLSAGSRFILICPNVVFDAGYGKITNIFPSMKEWLICTIQYLLTNTNHLIVVRAHPGEGLWWGGKEPIHEVLARYGISASERLVIIPGQAKVNTYRLMERCLFGIVFSSSSGLEMAVMGKHVLTASNVTYARRGFTYDPDNRADYISLLERLVKTEYLPDRDESVKKLALLFYYVYHWVAQYPYPYDKSTGISRNPPYNLLERKDMKKYLPYLDLIVMSKDEFANNIHSYLSAEKIMEKINSVANFCS